MPSIDSSNIGNVNNSFLAEQDKTTAEKGIHDAAVNWAKRAGYKTDKMSEKELSAKLQVAGLGTSIILKQIGKGKFEFQKENWGHKILRFLRLESHDVITERHLSNWQSTGKRTHEAAFNELKKFQKMGGNLQPLTTAIQEREAREAVRKVREQEQGKKSINTSDNTLKEVEVEEVIEEPRTSETEDRHESTTKLANKLSVKLSTLQKELNAHRKESAALESKKDDLSKELSAESSKLQRLQDQENWLETEREVSADTATILGASINSESASVQTNAESLGELRTKLNEEETNLIKGGATLKSLKEKLIVEGKKSIFNRNLTGIKENIAKVESEIAKGREKIGHLKETIDVYEAGDEVRLPKVSAELRRELANRNALEQEEETLEQEKMTLIESLHVSMKDGEAGIKGTEDGIQKSKAKIGEYAEIIREQRLTPQQKISIEELKQEQEIKLKELEQERGDLIKQREVYKKSDKAGIEDIKGSIGKTENKIAECKEKIKNCEGKIADLTAYKDIYTKRIAIRASQGKSKELSEDLAAALPSKKLEIAEQQKIIDEKQLEINKLTNEIMQLGTKTAGLEALIEQHSTSLQTLKQLGDGFSREINETMKKIQNQLSDTEAPKTEETAKKEESETLRTAPSPSSEETRARQAARRKLLGLE